MSDEWTDALIAAHARIRELEAEKKAPRDEQVREQTLRDAIERISSDARYTLDGVSEYEAGIICDKLRHMIEKDKTNE